MAIRVFGLTGGVASGKSSVARCFESRGVPVIDADQLARQVVAKGTDGLAAVVQAFGAGILTPGGALDRPKLAGIVFADSGERQRLEAIVHPRIAQASAARIRALDEQGVGWCCYEAALLVENGLAEAFRPLVVVSVDIATQLRRMMARDSISEREAQRRIFSQAPLDDKLAVADYIIDNNGRRDALTHRADEVLRSIRER